MKTPPLVPVAAAEDFAYPLGAPLPLSIAPAKIIVPPPVDCVVEPPALLIMLLFAIEIVPEPEALEFAAPES